VPPHLHHRHPLLRLSGSLFPPKSRSSSTCNRRRPASQHSPPPPPQTVCVGGMTVVVYVCCLCMGRRGRSSSVCVCVCVCVCPACVGTPRTGYVGPPSVCLTTHPPPLVQESNWTPPQGGRPLHRAGRSNPDRKLSFGIEGQSRKECREAHQALG
jgi:hypothetical protein